MKVRPVLAFLAGFVCGFAFAKLLGLGIEPFLPVDRTEVWFLHIVSLLLVSAIAGTVAPLISWKHTPGLPGMTFALTIAAIGISTNATTSASETKPLEASVVLLGILLTYMLAWAVDTQVVFRGLRVKPQPKQIDTRIIMTKLLPSTILIAAGSAPLGFLIPLPAWISIFLSFGVMSFLCVWLFKMKSTLWYVAAAPVHLAASAWNPIATPGAWQEQNTLTFCGFGAAGAILGYWLRKN